MSLREASPRFESGRLTHCHRKVVAKNSKAAADVREEVRDEYYYDVVLSALRIDRRKGHRDDEGKEV